MAELLLLFAILFTLIAMGAPIHVSLGVSGLMFFIADGLPLTAATQTVVNGTNSFTLIAIPFFIFAGHLMNEAKVTDRIFAFARALVGWMPGGLGHVNIGSSVIFAGMSGAAVADAGGLGAIEIKAMQDAGYDKPFAVGLTAASSTIGPIIPPSLALIVYGVMAEVSIGELFAAGLIPGLIMAISLMLMVIWFAIRRDYPRDKSFSASQAIKGAREAILPLLTPVIIIGGIVSGAFTPTESAVAAVFYTLFIGVVIYKTLSLSSIYSAALETIKTTAAVLMIVASAALFAWVLTANQAASLLTDYLIPVSESPTLVLFVMMGIVFIFGFFMETIAAITILVPLFLPTALVAGIDPVHLGIVLVLNLMIGLLTPPVGMVLYVLAKVSKTSFSDCVKAVLPFLTPLFIVLILLIIFPQISLWLPQKLYP